MAWEICFTKREKEWRRWTCSDKIYIYYCGTTSHSFLLLPPSSSSSWQLLHIRCFLSQRQTQLVRIMIRSRLPKRGRKHGCRTRSRHWSHTARRWTVCSTHPRVTSICGSKFPKRWRSEAMTAPLPCALISGAICWKSTRRPRFKTKAHPKLHASKTWRSFWVSAPSPSHTATLPNWMHCNKVQMLKSFESCVHPIHVWGWSLDLGSLLVVGSLRSDQDQPLCQTAEQDVNCHDIDLWKWAQIILQTNLMQSCIYEVLWKQKTWNAP